jgi:hypothetical protein
MYNRTLGPPLNTKDLWKVDTTQMMSNISDRFDLLLRRPDDEESFRLFTHPPNNVLEEMWEFKLVRILVLMYVNNNEWDIYESTLLSKYANFYARYWKELVEAGFFKLLNTLMTFVPPLMVAAILRGLDSAPPASIKSSTSLLSAKSRGFILSMMLLLALSVKTILDNQYFYVITNTGAAVRGAVATAVYRKLLKLRECDRFKFSVSLSFLSLRYYRFFINVFS